MARYIKKYELTTTEKEALMFASDYFFKQGFKTTLYKGQEKVFQKSNGWVANPKFAKIYIDGNLLVIEAWVAFSLVPTTSTGEIDITEPGFKAIAIKKQMQNIIFPFEQSLVEMGITNGVPVNV